MRPPEMRRRRLGEAVAQQAVRAMRGSGSGCGENCGIAADVAEGAAAHVGSAHADAHAEETSNASWWAGSLAYNPVDHFARWLEASRDGSRQRRLLFACYGLALFGLCADMLGTIVGWCSYTIVARVYLRAIALCMGGAFASLAVQVVGLVGSQGVVPCEEALQNMERVVQSGRLRTRLPSAASTALQLLTKLVLHTFRGVSDVWLERYAWLGAVLAGATALFPNPLAFFVLYVLYFAYKRITGIFLNLQWDALILELGFLATILSLLPLLPPVGVTCLIWLHTLVLLRLMLCSGLVKIASRCPNWRKLTAMQVHFWTQPLPAPLGYLAHHAPPWVLKLSTIMTFVFEGPACVLQFVPGVRARSVAWASYVGLMAMIALTGNYGFFNAATIALSTCLLPDSAPGIRALEVWARGWNKFALLLGTGGGIAGQDCTNMATALWQDASAVVPTWFRALLLPSGAVPLARLTRPASNTALLSWVLHGRVAVFWGARPIAAADVAAIANAHTLQQHGAASAAAPWMLLGRWSTWVNMAPAVAILVAMLMLLLVAVVTVWLAAAFSVPVADLFKRLGCSWNTPKRVELCQRCASVFSVAGSYGLFARMTTFRDELTFEVSMDGGQSYRALEFKYKPGDPATIKHVPWLHMPRLDWRLWFVPLRPQYVPDWVRDFCQRLLQGSEPVYRLLDWRHNSTFLPHVFDCEGRMKQPPTHVRVTMARYEFAPPPPAHELLSALVRRSLGGADTLSGVPSDVCARACTGADADADADTGRDNDSGSADTLAAAPATDVSRRLFWRVVSPRLYLRPQTRHQQPSEQERAAVSAHTSGFTKSTNPDAVQLMRWLLRQRRAAAAALAETRAANQEAQASPTPATEAAVATEPPASSKAGTSPPPALIAPDRHSLSVSSGVEPARDGNGARHNIADAVQTPLTEEDGPSLVAEQTHEMERVASASPASV